MLVYYYAWNLTETERLTLYYDSVEALGRLACFQCLSFFSASSRSHSRIECEDDNRKDNKALRSVISITKIPKFRLKCLLTFFPIQTFVNSNIALPYAKRPESRYVTVDYDGNYVTFHELNVRITIKEKTINS